MKRNDETGNVGTAAALVRRMVAIERALNRIERVSREESVNSPGYAALQYELQLIAEMLLAREE